MNWQEDSNGSNVAQELTAQIQLGLFGTVGKLARQMRVIDAICPALKAGGLIRKIDVDREAQRHAVGIAATSRHLPAWGGLLYSTGALKQGVVVEGATIVRTFQDSRVDVGDMTWLEYERRLEWKCFRQVYELLDDLFSNSLELPNLIVLDVPLVVGKNSYAQVLDDSDLNRELKDEISQLRAQVEQFWNINLHKCYPYDLNGPKIVSLGRRKFGSLLHLLEDRGGSATPDPINPEVISIIQAKWKDILSIGIERLMTGILSSGHRSAAFAFRMDKLENLNFPQALIQEGLMGFHYVAGLRTDPVLVQTVGSVTSWDHAGGSHALDELAEMLMGLTYFDSKRAVPLPLWYAREGIKVIKSPGPLEYYRQSTLKAMKDEQVEQTWLLGWEVE